MENTGNYFLISYCYIFYLLLQPKPVEVDDIQLGILTKVNQVEDISNNTPANEKGLTSN